MRTICGGVLIVSMAALLGDSGLAQGPPFGGIGAPSDPAALLGHEGVQKELKIDQRQKEQVQQALQEVLKKHKKDLDKLGKISPKENEKRTKQLEQLKKTISEENMKVLDKVLQPEQMRRLKQIDLQHQGIRAFDNPRVQEKLQLTNGQKKSIKAIEEHAQQEISKLLPQFLKEGDFRGAREKMNDLRKKKLEDALDVLRDDQKKIWKDLTGEPFSLPFAPPPGGKK